jgi:predicted dehydrogenase
MIRSGEMGRIRFVTAHVEQAWLRHARTQKGQGTWRADPAKAGGGQLMDTGSHTVAAMLQVTGLKPSRVFAFCDHAGLDVDVNSSIAVRFEGGAQASVTVGGFGHSVTESLRIVGENHSARIFFRTVREQALEIDGQVIDARAELPGSTPNGNLIEAIAGREAIGADVDLGLRVARLTEAAYRSAAGGTPVTVAAGT